MDKKEILKRLEELYNINEVNEGFESQQAAISWSNKVAPLLKLVNLQYYTNFILNSHKLNLPLSSYTLEPAFNIMKSQLEMAIEELKNDLASEDTENSKETFNKGVTPKEAMEIFDTFNTYAQTRDESLIDKYVTDKLKSAKYYLRKKYGDTGAYEEIEKRIFLLEQNKKEKRRRESTVQQEYKDLSMIKRLFRNPWVRGIGVGLIILLIWNYVILPLGNQGEVIDTDKIFLGIRYAYNFKYPDGKSYKEATLNDGDRIIDEPLPLDININRKHEQSPVFAVDNTTNSKTIDDVTLEIILPAEFAVTENLLPSWIPQGNNRYSTKIKFVEGGRGRNVEALHFTVTEPGLYPFVYVISSRSFKAFRRMAYLNVYSKEHANAEKGL